MKIIVISVLSGMLVVSSASAASEGISFEGGLTVTAQFSDDNALKNGYFASLDLVFGLPVGPGKFTAYIEGNTTPRENGVGTVLGEVNSDLGSALDASGNGRLQVSEFHYALPAGPGTLTVGLLDASAFIDGSEIANDETTQFLAGPFVNNPTIAFPDYSLGIAYQIEPQHNWPGINFVITSSHGLADNEHANYTQLFDIADDEKGVFAAAEAVWPADNNIFRAGVWTNTGDNVLLDGSGRTEENYGIYVSNDHTFSFGKINLRAGIANKLVSPAASFIALSYETEIAGYTVGTAISQANVSEKAGPGTGDTRIFELYGRYDLNKQLQITPSIQWIENSNFDSTQTAYDDQITIFSLRMNYAF